jgi:hypothetical protein
MPSTAYYACIYPVSIDSSDEKMSHVMDIVVDNE